MNRDAWKVLNEPPYRGTKKSAYVPQTGKMLVPRGKVKSRGGAKGGFLSWAGMVSGGFRSHRETYCGNWNAAQRALAEIFDKERDTFPAKSTSVPFDVQISIDPDPLALFRTQIDESRSILELPDDWDECGSRAIQRAHWKRVVEFLLTAAETLWRRDKRILVVPAIGPVPGGSIDVHWKTEKGELLIEVPSSPEEVASFYGDNYGRRKIKGTLDLSDDDYFLFLWMRLVE